jgi:enamine deaminase RidA (YjgF/YER057c/UK114 family)
MPAARGAEIAINVLPLPGDGIHEPFDRLARAVAEHEAALLHLRVYAGTRAWHAGMEALRRCFGPADLPPVSWIDGAACDTSPIAGLQAVAFTGREVRRFRGNGRAIAATVDDGSFRHCHVGGLLPHDLSSSRADQAAQTLDALAEALSQAGFALADVVRTWFFLDEILAWYPEFNQARTRVYSGIRFQTGSLPASTGIGARNPARAALTVEAWAARPLLDGSSFKEIASPLQCPAPAYGSSFSRAMEMASPAGQRVLVSGTASIAPEGNTLWKGDARKQVGQTLQVVETLLCSRGLSFEDVTRATAYFKRPGDLPLFREFCATNGVALPPVVCALGDICRSDLLFELELDAGQAGEAA